MRKKIEEFLHINSNIESGGGKEKIDIQHKSGKLTSRERIDLLVDEGSFIEIDKFLGSSEVVTGYGTVNGRLIFVYSQDYTVLDGALGKLQAEKICKVQEMALKMGAPIIAFMDSKGGKISEGIDTISGYGKVIYNNTISSGVIPQISVILGPCLGAGAYSQGLMDFVFMIEKNSLMFINGSKVIRAAEEKEISLEEIGSGKIHNEITGISHFIDKTEEESIARLRKLLSFMPSNNLEDVPVDNTSDNINRVEDALNNIIPVDLKEPYDVKNIIKLIGDEKEFFEIQCDFAKNIVIGFIRLNGKVIGVVANQRQISEGFLDMDSCRKASRFIRTCDSFGIPLLNIVDVEGFLPRLEQEHNGIISAGAKLMYSFAEATVPKVTLIIGKAYGSAYLAMCSKGLGADQVFAWPNGEISIMAPEGAANILFNKEIANVANPIEARNEKILQYKNDVANPYKAAEMGYIDDIIVPSTTRPRLIAAFDMLETKREIRPSKKHGNLPL